MKDLISSYKEIEIRFNFLKIHSSVFFQTETKHSR